MDEETQGTNDTPAPTVDQVKAYRTGDGWTVEVVGSEPGVGLPWWKEYRHHGSELFDAVDGALAVTGFRFGPDRTTTPGFAPPAITTWADVHPGDLVAPGYRSPVGRPADGDWRRVRSVASAGRKLVEVVCAGESPAKHIETGEVWVMVALPTPASIPSSFAAVAS